MKTVGSLSTNQRTCEQKIEIHSLQSYLTWKWNDVKAMEKSSSLSRHGYSSTSFIYCLCPKNQITSTKSCKHAIIFQLTCISGKKVFFFIFLPADRVELLIELKLNYWRVHWTLDFPVLVANAMVRDPQSCKKIYGWWCKWYLRRTAWGNVKTVMDIKNEQW